MIIRTIIQASPAVLFRVCTRQTSSVFSMTGSNRATTSKAMSTSTTSSVPHEERTATEPREHGMHKVILHRIEEVNTNIRLLKLRMHNGDEQLQACNLGHCTEFALTYDLCSVVPPRAMARCVRPLCPAGRRLYDYLYTRRPYTR